MGPAVTLIFNLTKTLLDCHPKWLLRFTLPPAVKILVSSYISYLTCFILVGIDRYFAVICAVIFSDSYRTSFNVFIGHLHIFFLRHFYSEPLTILISCFNFRWKFLLFLLDTNPLSDTWLMNIFFLYVSCLCLFYCILCSEIIYKFQQSPTYLFFPLLLLPWYHI